jgi:hypothetical protein
VINFDVPEGLEQSALLNTLVNVQIHEAQPFSLLGALV